MQPVTIDSAPQLAAARLHAVQYLTVAGNHALFDAADRERIFRRELSRALEAGAVLHVLQDGADVRAVLGAVDSPADGAHFGLRMARLVGGCAPDVPHDLLVALVNRVLDAHLGADRCQHVAFELSIDDYALLNALVACGFRVFDMKRTGYADRLRPRVDVQRLGRSMRRYEARDREAVLALVRASDFQTRFTRDPSLDAALARGYYVQWLERLLDGQGVTSNVLVFERGGRVVGCGAIGERDFSPYGMARKVRAGSLYVSDPAGVGGYVPILHTLAAEAIASHGSVETTISLNNTPALRVLDALGPNRPSISTLALHLWHGWRLGPRGVRAT